MGKKKLLIYTNYYSPDVASIGQILRELAEGMLEEFDITVICTVPSYSGKVAPEYQTRHLFKEDLNGVHLFRIKVPAFDKRNKLSRVKHILAYFFGALFTTFKVGKQDYVLCSSDPPVIGGLLGVWGKWMKHAKFIYNIQDYNPEAIMAVGYSRNRMMLSLMMALDKFTCRHSNLVITVGRDLIETLHKRFDGHKVPASTMINNWADEKAIYPLASDDSHVEAFKKKYHLENKFVIMYSGNIGLYYDLENLIKVIRNFSAGSKSADGREVEFVFIGQGAQLMALKDYVTENQMRNVQFLPYQPKADLNYSLNAADIHWCVSARGIKGVSCPSKFYGIAAAGKPVLGVLEQGAEIELLIKEVNGGFLAEPGDYDKVRDNIQAAIDSPELILEMGRVNRDLVEKRLTKSASIRRYIEEIQAI